MVSREGPCACRLALKADDVYLPISHYRLIKNVSSANIAMSSHLTEQRLLCRPIIQNYANHIFGLGRLHVSVGIRRHPPMVSIMTALYFQTLRPEDRVAVAARFTSFHAIARWANRDARRWRTFGATVAPKLSIMDWAITDDVDFSTAWLGLVAVTSFASIAGLPG
jgi:hypothetical protein